MFDRVPLGATGEIIYQPVLLAVVEGHIYVESHRDVYRQFSKPLERLRASAGQLHLTDAIDWSLAAAVIRDNAGIARDVTAAPCAASGPPHYSNTSESVHTRAEPGGFMVTLRKILVSPNECMTREL